MKQDFIELKLQQLDTTLARWRAAELSTRPHSGWIKAIRETLGMPATLLAKRLGVVASTVTRLEKSEADDSISLSTLRRAAEALDCELHYVLVPRQSLADTLASRANQIARERMADVAHNMALESQTTSNETVTNQTRALADSLLKGPRRELWREKK